MYIEYGHNMDECIIIIIIYDVHVIIIIIPGPCECRHTPGGRECHRQSQCVDDRDPAIIIIMDLQCQVRLLYNKYIIIVQYLYFFSHSTL